MNNEIGRKLTSLTLMTIMLAAGFTAFAPSAMQSAAAANANLFVSAENSQFQNYFAGPMVIEVVVIDSDLKDTDKGKGEPDVTVNGNKLRMAQATDGNWYGYFADRAQAQKADATSNLGPTYNGTGLDFGVFCSAATAANNIGPAFTQTVGVALPRQLKSGTGVTLGSQGETSTGSSIDTACSTRAPLINLNNSATQNLHNNVVRENKTLNRGSSTVSIGQIGILQSNYWPFIQLYNFNPTGNVVVQYNKGGGVQSTTLKFDTVDQFAKAELDRAFYPQGAQVQLTVTDLQLNVDPTDEDSWTFGTLATNATTYYSVFNEDGALSKSGQMGPVISKALTGNLTGLMFEDNGVLKVNVNAQSASSNIIQLQDNADTNMTSSGSINAGRSTITAASQPITLTETAPNTGVFGTYDENDVSVIKTTSSAPRGKSATIDYNASPASVVIGFGFASVDIVPVDAEWNSGQEIPVRVTDSDANKNSRADEDLDFNNANVSLLPALRIGTPFTLGAKGTESSTTAASVYLLNFTGNAAGTLINQRPTVGASAFAYSPTATKAAGLAGVHEGNMTVQKFSDRALVTTNRTASATALLIDTKATAQDLKNSIIDPRQSSTPKFFGFNLVNLDIRGISSSTITNASVYLVNSTNTIITRQSGASGAELEITATAATTKLIPIAHNVGPQSLKLINDTLGTAQNAKVYSNIFGGSTGGGIHGGATAATTNIGFLVNFTRVANVTSTAPIAVDLFTFGYKNDGLTKSDRVNNMLVRIEAEETGDNTSVFEGSLEFVVLNQLNILDSTTYTGLTAIADDPSFIVHQDLDDEEAPRVSYNDLAGDGTVTQVSDQEDAPTHSGVVSFNQPTYKKADTVVVTVEDQDLNTDVDLIDIYTVVNNTNTASNGGTPDTANDAVGKAGLPTLSNGDALGRLLDITFDDARWKDTNNACATSLRSEGHDVGLFASGFTLIETGAASGIFTGDFIVPGKVCNIASGVQSTPVNAQGLDMEVNYVDFRDASGQIVEVGDGAGIRANTGSVSLDRTVYPVPFGPFGAFATPTDNTAPNGRAIFPIHLTGIGTNGIEIGRASCRERV